MVELRYKMGDMHSHVEMWTYVEGNQEIENMRCITDNRTDEVIVQIENKHVKDVTQALLDKIQSSMSRIVTVFADNTDDLLEQEEWYSITSVQAYAALLTDIVYQHAKNGD